MIKSRERLRKILIRILSSVDVSYKEKHLYFRRPSGKMNYPCIVYDLVKDDPKYANNRKYINHDEYIITVIDEDEDSPIKEAVCELPLCTFDRLFKTEGLNHFVFKIYI